jgi:hypothetical protein
MTGVKKMAKSGSGGVSDKYDTEGELPSVGYSSSRSEKKQDKSGKPSTTGLPSPVPSAESPSSPDPLPLSQESSTAPSTDGSGPETTSDPSDPQTSSGTPAADTPLQHDAEPEVEGSDVPPATTAEEEAANLARAARDLVKYARQSYDAGDYDQAISLLNEAEKLSPDAVDGVIEQARQDIAVALSRQEDTTK